MPLPFVGKTTTIRMDDNETQPDFEIPAMDTTIGTSPSGSAWRRNPIPACNCDLGEEGSCWGGGNKGYGGGNFTKAYEIDPQAPKKTPRCPTGVQFPPAWPEGCALPTPKPCVLRMPCFPWLSDEDQNWFFFCLGFRGPDNDDHVLCCVQTVSPLPTTRLRPRRSSRLASTPKASAAPSQRTR